MFLSLLFSTFLSSAQAVPLQVTQQGRVLDSNGAAVTGMHDITFRIFDSANGGTEYWTETLTVSFANGYYAAILGSDEQNNPLDSDTLALYPLFLEVQLDSNTPISTRYAINSAPYAQMAGVAEKAESVDGGVVNASEVQINSTQVIDGSGNWVGQPITVDWNNIDPNTIPSYIADGDDNTQLSKSEVLNYVNGEALSLASGTQVDGSDVVTADSFAGYLPSDLADGDADTLASLSCATGEIASWDGSSSWVCTSDATLSFSDVETMLAGNAVDLNAATTIGGEAIITTVDDADTLAGLSCQLGEVAKYDDTLGDWYCDIDIDTVLSDSDVLGYVNGEALSLASGTQVNGSDVVTADSFAGYLPSELADGDADSLAATTCTNGQVLIYDGTSGWICGDDTDTTLTQSEVQSLIELMSGLALASNTTIGGEAPLVASNHGDDPDAHHSHSSDGLDITPSSVTIQNTSTVLTDGNLDLGASSDDALTAAMVQTLTGGGDADSLHTHAASGGGGACYNVWGTTTCGAGHTQIYSGIGVAPIIYNYHTTGQDWTSFGVSDLKCVDVTNTPQSGTSLSVTLIEGGTNRKYSPSSNFECALCCQ